MRILLIGLFVLCLAGPALATSYKFSDCMGREAWVRILDARFHEHLQARGIQSSSVGDVVIEFFASDVGSWTLLYSFPNGTSCLLGGGDNWQKSTEKVPEPPKEPGT